MVTASSSSKKKLFSSAISLDAFDEADITMVPQTGNIVGSSEGPALFSWAYNKQFDRWLACRKIVDDSPSITLVHPRGTRHTAVAVLFADDSATRKIIPPHQSLQQAIIGLMNEDKCFDEVIGKGNWVQNTSKAYIVPSLGNSGLRQFRAIAASDPDTKYIADRCLPHARHLGGTVAYNGSLLKEIEKRLEAIRVGWSSLGRFWTSRARRNLKRKVLLSYVVEAGISGLSAMAPSEAQLGKLTSKICTYLRVLEQGKAYVLPEEQAATYAAEGTEDGPEEADVDSCDELGVNVNFVSGGVVGGLPENVSGAAAAEDSSLIGGRHQHAPTPDHQVTNTSQIPRDDTEDDQTHTEEEDPFGFHDLDLDNQSTVQPRGMPPSHQLPPLRQQENSNLNTGEARSKPMSDQHGRSEPPQAAARQHKLAQESSRALDDSTCGRPNLSPLPTPASLVHTSLGTQKQRH